MPRPFVVGGYVKTPNGVGMVLFYTDYQRIDGLSDPQSAVVVFRNRWTNLYPVSELASATEHEYYHSPLPFEKVPAGNVPGSEGAAKTAKTAPSPALAEA